MKGKPSLIQTQKPVLAQVLQQSISVLMLSNTELTAAIDQELQSNPLLESEMNTLPAKPSVTDLHKSLKHATDVPLYDNAVTEEDNEDGFRIPQTESFEEHVLSQLRLEINDPVELKLGSLIVGNLNSDGYLEASLQDIAEAADVDDLAVIERVLKKIQTFEPVGTGSRNLEECLSIQLQLSDSPVKGPALKIVAGHLKELSQKRFETIAQKLNVPVAQVKEAAQLIATLEPKPARNYQTFDQTYYVQPDLYVTKNPDGTFRIELNRKDTPPLRINPLYQQLLSSKTITDQERKFIQDKLTNAVNFIKSVQQRGETLVKIAKYIVEHQMSFFEGNTSSLTPMTLKDIAQELERNESTISRAIHNKYMDTPMGIFALKFFFSQAVNEANKNVSSYNIKEEIRQLIEDEDKTRPLSDQDIQDHFQGKGITLARRTVNKYRQELDIPPANQRKSV